MKLVHFTNPEVPFINTTIDWAIQSLPQTYLSYTYNDLKRLEFTAPVNDLVFFFEAGQLQRKHGGLPLKTFKEIWPKCKVVIWSSDGIYYRVNGEPDQFDCKLADLVIDVMPQMVEYWRGKGCSSECLPWTISRKLHTQLRQLAGSTVDFSRKTNDFFALWNCSCDYRNNFFDYIKKSGYRIIQGGSGKYDIDDLDQVFNNCMDSFISCETSSHNRIELLNMGNQKGFRSAISISLNTLVINDDHPNNSICGMPFPKYKFGEYKSVINVLQWLKRDLFAYEYILKQQQEWLRCNLLDELILNTMKKYNIL